uniref:Uncharacterized protein n=1 Tax=Physcomitrium patens TaxID=3218 RepID=A0A2K1K9U2_PHYPA|nr:protein ORANGE, chloroplastic-like [Physcomitrium patens]PNR50539.1 hypothetical protein PHYPA_009725 [Physcomitrium patens]|eukprot:XP_024381579.1 protein ORANGE, chloroplastic-like [Physcomitrella patens]
MESITSNEVAGFAVGALLLAAALATPKVDAFIAREQRRDLKLCMECGGVTRIPCARCKARGTINQNIFSFDDSNKPTTCPACRGRGNFPCPSCCGNKPGSSSSS